MDILRKAQGWCIFFTVLLAFVAVWAVACDSGSSGGDGDDADDDSDSPGYGDGDDYGDDDDGNNVSDDDATDDDDSYSDDDDDDDDDDACDDDDSSQTDDDDDDDDDDTPDYECPDQTEPTVLYLSADDSNSQASPVIARAIIRQGDLVPAEKIRTYEFTNYYQIDYPAPEPGRINVVPQMRLHEDGEYPGEYTFQIGAQSHRLTRSQGRSMSIVLSLDTSGSMGGWPIALLRESCRAIAGELREGDVISIVSWSSSTSVVLDSLFVSGPNDPRLLEVIDALQSDGSTDLHGGLVRAYELARRNFSQYRLNRVVLISDGQANAGVTDINLIAQAADDEEGEGIYLVGVGVGEPYDYYHDKLMDQVTDAGKGAYVYIDSELEARKQFGERFMENMELAAMDVRIKLTMPYYFLMKEFHGEEYSPNPEEVEPQHLGPNDAMVFHQYLIACDTELVDPGDTITVEAQYFDPFTREEKVDVKSRTVARMLDTDADQLLKGDAVVTYAEALKQIWEASYNSDEALAICRAAKEKVSVAAAILVDGELWDIVELLEQVENILGH